MLKKWVLVGVLVLAGGRAAVAAPYNQSVADFQKKTAYMAIFAEGAQRAVQCSLRSQHWADVAFDKQVELAQFFFNQIWPVGDPERDTVGTAELASVLNAIVAGNRAGMTMTTPTCQELLTFLPNMDDFEASAP